MRTVAPTSASWRHGLLLFVTAWTVTLAGLGTGCGHGTEPEAAAGATVNGPLSPEDLPVCGVGSTTTPPPAAGGTPDPHAGPAQAGQRLERYHLAEGATDRDRFFLAILRDDSTTLGQLLERGMDPNAARARTYSIASDGLVTFGSPGIRAASEDAAHAVPALFWAAQSSYSGETLVQLVHHHADISARDERGRTPLLAAAGNEYLALTGLKTLLDAGADPHALDSLQEDALLLAASTANRDHTVLCLAQQKLRLLISVGADINENLTAPPLLVALFNRNLELAKLVHGLGGDTRTKATLDGSSALHMLARSGHAEVEAVRWLLRRGVDVHARDQAGKTALELFQADLTDGKCPSCHDGYAEIIRLLEHRRH